MKDKKKFILGILSVLWGVIFFCYKMFFPTSVYDLLGSKSFQYSNEQIALYKEGLQNLITIFDILFILFLVILVLIIKLKKMNIKLRSNYSMILIIIGLVFHILGLVGISWIFVIASGILLIINKKD